MSDVKYILEMKEISKSFPGVKALDNVSLSIRKGEIHALMGENGAGKTTLMKILFGIYKMDEGEIYFDGKLVSIQNPHDALKLGIAMVQQELEQVPKRTVMDNIWLGRLPMRGIFVDEAKMYADTLKIMKDLGMEINPKALIADLSVSTKQMADILKAISYNARLIVLDEPTSSLTENETANLFKIIRRLKEEGCGVIYISHKIDEVMSLADRVTVMRDGCWIASENVSDIDQNTLIRLMVNREISNRFPEKESTPGDVYLEVEDIYTEYPQRLNGVTFNVRKGEIFGIGGLVGAGRTEILETLFGLRTITSGKIRISGKDILGRRKKVKQNVMGLVTEERRATGIFPLLDIRWNIVIASLKKNTDMAGFLSNKKLFKNTREMVDTLHIKTPTLHTLISDLSGGNQQKVLVGRCLQKDSMILLLDEPTRGIDVGAKQEIYQIMTSLAKEGVTILFVSSEMPELLGMADRILVVSNGRSAGIVNAKDCDQEEIMKLATMYL